MPDTSTRLFSLSLVIIMALWAPVCCCPSADAAVNGNLVSTVSAGHPTYHQTLKSNGQHSHKSHCPPDSPDTDCPQLQPMLTAVDASFIVSSQLLGTIAFPLQALPGHFALFTDTLQISRASRYRAFAASAPIFTRALRAQRVLLLV